MRSLRIIRESSVPFWLQLRHLHPLQLHQLWVLQLLRQLHLLGRPRVQGLPRFLNQRLNLHAAINKAWPSTVLNPPYSKFVGQVRNFDTSSKGSQHTGYCRYYEGIDWHLDNAFRAAATVFSTDLPLAPAACAASSSAAGSGFSASRQFSGRRWVKNLKLIGATVLGHCISIFGLYSCRILQAIPFF